MEDFGDMKRILVTGANGQLGKCIQDAAADFPHLEFVFVSKETLDISNADSLREYFTKNKFTHCINTAAYTNVEKAESEAEQAFAINAEAVKNLAAVCQNHDCVLLHISTDYVFDGKKRTAYVETDETNPINVYGASKLKGEQYIQDICEKFFIFRTSWLYSQYGHNFLKTILNYAEAGKPLTVTTQQTGTPTNANDLAAALLQVIAQDSGDYGLYHYSNAGQTTWFGFAEEILKQSGKLESTKLAKISHYRTFAARPEYSVLDSSLISEKLQIFPVSWEKSLKKGNFI